MNVFIKKLVGFSLGPIIGAFISFITIPITTYFVSPTEFGKASMFMIVQSLAVTFLYFGIDQSYAREYHENNDKKKLFQNALLLPLCVTFILFIVICFYSVKFSIFLFNSPKYQNISVLFGIMLIFSVIERFILLSIRMEERAVEYSIYNIFIKGLILIFTILLIFLGRKDFTTVVYATIFGQIIGDLMLSTKYKILFKIDRSFLNLRLIKKMILFGFPLIIAASVNNLLTTSGRFFLRGYSTYSELGIYNAALKISSIITVIQTAFTSFWVPTAYRWNKERKGMKQFNAVGDLLLLAMTVMFFFVLFFKKYIVIILSSNYVSAQYVVGLLAMIPILYTLSEATTLGIAFSGKSYFNILVSLFSLLPNVLLCWLLVPIYGTVGAAIAAAVSYVVFCILRTWFSNLCGFKISFKKQFINIVIFLMAALVNTYDKPSVAIANIVLFVIALLTQYGTIKTIFDIKSNPDDWDFS